GGCASSDLAGICRREGRGMKARLLLLATAALTLIGMIGLAPPARAGSGVRPGTLPSRVPASARLASGLAGHLPSVASRLGVPTPGASWRGLNDPSLSPADPNGAI